MITFLTNSPSCVKPIALMLIITKDMDMFTELNVRMSMIIYHLEAFHEVYHLELLARFFPNCHPISVNSWIPQLASSYPH